MAGTFNLQVVTPEREVFNGTVDSVTLPGLESRFGVLRNHAPLIAALHRAWSRLWTKVAAKHAWQLAAASSGF
jgi:F-type H+-transporting ATPase subunit epsilon